MSGMTIFSQNDVCSELESLIHKTYNFKPSKLSSSEKTKKSEQMDVVWKKVKAKKTELIPCLKRAMNKPDANNFFIFDASNLIFSLDKSDESKKLIIKSYAKVDLGDVNLEFWIRYISILGYSGFNTSAAGENWLRSSVKGYYLPQHGTRKVTKDIGSVIVYGSMDEKFAAPSLARVIADKGHPERVNALILLIQQMTPEATAILRELRKKEISEEMKAAINKFFTSPELIVARKGDPKTTREQYLTAFRDLIEGRSRKFIALIVSVPDGEKDAIAVLKREDIPLIRKARRYFATTANPHSPEWYRSFTKILSTLIRQEDKKSY